MAIPDLATLLPKVLGPQLMALLALIVIQVLLAVALAIREKLFDWKLLADFYRTRVIPLLIGWLGFVILSRFASAAVLGPTYGVLVGEGVTWLAWLAVVASLGARVIETAKQLYGSALPFKEPNG